MSSNFVSLSARTIFSEFLPAFVHALKRSRGFATRRHECRQPPGLARRSDCADVSICGALDRGLVPALLAADAAESVAAPAFAAVGQHQRERGVVPSLAL